MLQKLRNNREFIGHVLSIVSGRGAAALVGLALTPIVARLFSPGDYGLAAFFLAMAGIAAQIGTFRYDSAFALPKDEKEALLLVVLASRILPMFCLALLAIIAIVRFGGISWRALDQLGNWLWLLPFTVFIMTAQDVQEAWLARKRSFGVIGRSVVVDATVGGTSRVVFGILQGSSVHGLIFGHLLGVMTRLVAQGRASLDSLGATFQRVELSTLLGIARRYSDFPKLSAPAALVFAVGQNFPVLMFGALFSPASAGFFAMANRLSRIPVQIVTTSVSRVFLQKAASIHNDGRSLRRSLHMSTFGLLAMGLVPCAIIWLYGQLILGWLLGQRWYLAGAYLEVMAPWVLVAWITAPCNPVFVVLRKQTYWLRLQLVLTISRIGVFAIGYGMGLGERGTLKLFVAVAVAGNLVTIAITFWLTRHSQLRSPA